MLSPKKKQSLINKFRKHDKDTGSAEVQIAILTEEIKELTKHLREHKQDHSSRRGLLKKIGERRRLLRYLEIDNPESYKSLLDELKLKPLKKEERDKELKTILAEDAAEPSVAAEPAATVEEEKKTKETEG